MHFHPKGRCERRYEVHMDLFLASCKQIPHVAAIHVPATNSYLPFQQPSSRCPDSQGRGPVLGLLVIPDIVVQWPWLCYNLLIGGDLPIQPTYRLQYPYTIYLGKIDRVRVV